MRRFALFFNLSCKKTKKVTDKSAAPFFWQVKKRRHSDLLQLDLLSKKPVSTFTSRSILGQVFFQMQAELPCIPRKNSSACKPAVIKKKRAYLLPRTHLKPKP